MSKPFDSKSFGPPTTTSTSTSTADPESEKMAMFRRRVATGSRLAIRQTVEQLVDQRLGDPTRTKQVATHDSFALMPDIAPGLEKAIEDNVPRELIEQLFKGGKKKDVPPPKFGTAEFDGLLDQSTHSKKRGGNKVDMLFDGKNSM